jgi:hypothetical protein
LKVLVAYIYKTPFCERLASQATFFFTQQTFVNWRETNDPELNSTSVTYHHPPLKPSHIHIRHANFNINNILPRLGQAQAETWYPRSWYDSQIPTSCSFLEESFSSNSVAMFCL